MAAGFRGRHFFPHRALVLPRAGPDGAKIASRLFGVRGASELHQLVLHALPPVVDEFPALEALHAGTPVLAGEADIVVGSRFAEGGDDYRPPLARRLGIGLFARIVSLLPSTTEILFAIGAGDAVKLDAPAFL